MQHTTWAGHDGAPQGIRAIGRTQDGLLYVAALSGLYAFNGNSFDEVALNGVDPGLSSSVHGLLFTRSGNLILAVAHGAPVLVRDGVSRRLDRSDCGTIDVVSNLSEGRQGIIWAVLNERKIITLGPDDIWHEVRDPEAGAGHITYLYVSDDGTAWAVLNDRLYRRPGSAKEFVPTGVFAYGVVHLRGGLHSDLWIASAGPATTSIPARHLQHISNGGSSLPAASVDEPLTAVWPAKDGSLWVLTAHSVLAHLPAQRAESSSRVIVNQLADKVTLGTAVQEDGVHAMVIDEDSIWVGGMGGVERFRDALLIPLLPGSGPGIWEQCLQKDGSHWIVDSRGNLSFRTARDTVRRFGRDTAALFCAKSGDLARDDVGLVALEPERANRIPALPYLKGYSNHYIFTGAVRTADGAITAAAAGGATGRSLWRCRSGRWSKLLPVEMLPEVTSMFAMPDNEIELGFRDGHVGILTSDGMRILPVGQTGIGTVLGFQTTTYGLFAYGSKGIALERGKSFLLFSFAQSEVIAKTSGLVEANGGDLWLNGGKGIARVAARELERMIRDPSYRGIANNLSEGDFTGPSVPFLFSSSVQLGPDGRVWFSTLNGIVSVRPSDVSPTAAPALLIRGVLADGQPGPIDHAFPPGIGSLTIKYVGIDFTDPTGLSYAYKLDGYDHDWQSVGTRTEAVYTRLHAGRYVFQVKARNGFGTWTDPVVLAPFNVRPHIYEEHWFLAGIATISCMFAGFGVRFRLNTASANIRKRAEERADERIAIARDLHDTLLQGIQGLLMTFHSAAETVPKDHESKAALERALNSAEKLILEGRDRVKGLRGTEVSGEKVSFLLETVAEELGCRDQLQVTVSPQTGAAMMKQDVASEVFLVGREALLNAVRHANASRITIKLSFAPDCFFLEYEDDGCGFNVDQIDSAQGATRWGIRGMRERVHRLGGSLQFQSQIGIGTHFILSIKGPHAYQANVARR